MPEIKNLNFIDRYNIFCYICKICNNLKITKKTIKNES